MPDGRPLSEARAPREIPALLVRKGDVYAPGADGPQLLRTAAGKPLDPFDVFDRLTPTNRRIYIADLEGIARGEPQLDLWQELSREADLWIDGGVQKADQAIDILVAGARRAVLTTRRLLGKEELERAWGLSQELAIEVVVRLGAVVAADKAWAATPVEELTRQIRAVGPPLVILSFDDGMIDWDLVRRVGTQGTTYVGEGYTAGSVARLTEVHARGGIYHPDAATLLG